MPFPARYFAHLVCGPRLVRRGVFFRAVYVTVPYLFPRKTPLEQISLIVSSVLRTSLRPPDSASKRAYVSAALDLSWPITVSPFEQKSLVIVPLFDSTCPLIRVNVLRSYYKILTAAFRFDHFPCLSNPLCPPSTFPPPRPLSASAFLRTSLFYFPLLTFSALTSLLLSQIRNVSIFHARLCP